MRRIEDLGRLGFESLAGVSELSQAQQETLRGYFKGSMYETTLNLRFAAKSFKDASTFNAAALQVLMSDKLEQEASLVQAKVRNLEASTKRLDAASASITAANSFNDTDYANIAALTALMEAENVQPTYKTHLDLQKPS